MRVEVADGLCKKFLLKNVSDGELVLGGEGGEGTPVRAHERIPPQKKKHVLWYFWNASSIFPSL